MAEDQATVITDAVADILASCNVCPGCSEVVDSLSRLSSDTFTEAVAGAWAEVCAAYGLASPPGLHAVD